MIDWDDVRCLLAAAGGASVRLLPRTSGESPTFGVRRLRCRVPPSSPRPLRQAAFNGLCWRKAVLHRGSQASVAACDRLQSFAGGSELAAANIAWTCFAVSSAIAL